MKSEQQIKERIEELKVIRHNIMNSLIEDCTSKQGLFNQLNSTNSRVDELENILKDD